MSQESARHRLIREACDGLADRLIALEPTKSGSVAIHYQNGVPRKIVWGESTEPVEALLTPRPTP